MSKEKTRRITTTISLNEINNKTLFEKIKTLQSLPDEIVNDFLKCKGVLNTTKYKSKFSQHAE